MSVAPTNYIITTNSGTQDLADIFQVLPSGPTPALATDYNIPILGDLKNIFAPNLIGTSIGFDTDFKVSNGNFSNTDLSAIFAAKLFTITPDAQYSIFYSGGYYTIALTYSGNSNITFYENLNNIQLVVVGGGGGAGANTGGNFGLVDGGGGGAGGQISNTNINISANLPYSFIIGAGGRGGYSTGIIGNSGIGASGGTTSFSTTIASGGLGGHPPISSVLGPGLGGAGAGGGGGGGDGGVDLNPHFTPSINGDPGSSILIGATNYYFGGGGAGGSYVGQPTSLSNNAGGLGGGGGSGSGIYGNNGVSWTSPTLTPNYSAGFDTPAFGGWASTGGGGAGGNGASSIPAYKEGGKGGSGIVVLYFQYP